MKQIPKKIGGMKIEMREQIESKLKHIVASIEPYIGQSRKQKALLLSLVSLVAVMPFAIHYVTASTPPPVTSVVLVCCGLNTNTVTIAQGQSATINSIGINIGSGHTEFFIPISVSGNFSSASLTRFTVNWLFNSSVIIASQSFTSGPSYQTIGATYNGFTALSFLTASHTGNWNVVIQVQNNSGGTLYVTNSSAVFEVAGT